MTHTISPAFVPTWRTPARIKRPRRSARFALVLAVALAPAACAVDGASETDACPADRSDERVVARQIFDGDTLLLEDGRTVRLVGIDTPELGRDGKPSQPFAADAKAALARLAPPGAALRLRLDAERFDRYGRLLAHAFDADGTNVQTRLLEAGLATALVVPPRQWGVACYAAAEARAREARSGIWQLAQYQPIPAEDLPDSARGFRLVRGRVQRVGDSRANVWLNLSPNVAVRIPKDDLIYFDFDPRRLAGRRLEVRGWVARRSGQLRITVRHPAALTRLD